MRIIRHKALFGLEKKSERKRKEQEETVRLVVDKDHQCFVAGVIFFCKRCDVIALCRGPQ